MINIILRLLIGVILTLGTSVVCFSQTVKTNIPKDSLAGKFPPGFFKKMLDNNDSLQNLSLVHQRSIDSLEAIGTNPTSSWSSSMIIMATRLAVGILFFGMVLILSLLLFLYKTQKTFGGFAFQIIGLIIVVTAALFLIVTGYDKDQITPVIGLLGTIVGFIFGSNLSKQTNPSGERGN